MPTSHFNQINDILQLIIMTNPYKLLDIGVGFGKYGYLSREYLEFWDGKVWNGREKYYEWKRKIDGVEVFSEYITPVHNFIYDHIFIGNAIDILPTINEKYDIILLIDVLEHFDYFDGLNFLKECKKKSKNILISTPNNIGNQGDAFGNPYERHRFQWTQHHFNMYSEMFILPNIGGSMIVYIGDDSRQIYEKRKRILKRKNRELFRHYIGNILDYFKLKKTLKRLMRIK